MLSAHAAGARREAPRCQESDADSAHERRGDKRGARAGGAAGIGFAFCPRPAKTPNVVVPLLARRLVFNQQSQPYTGNGLCQAVKDLIAELQTDSLLNDEGFELPGLRHRPP